MENLGTIKLESERLVLRQVVACDAEYAFRNWTRHNEVTKYLRWKSHSCIGDTKRIFSEWESSYDDKDFYNWIIVMKDIDEPIGNIAVVSKSKTDKMVHIGYCLGEDWWGKGIMTEALCAVIKFFFEEVKVRRVESQHDPKNVGSGKVMVKAGMKYERTIKSADYNNLGVCDVVMYSISLEDYINYTSIVINK